MSSRDTYSAMASSICQGWSRPQHAHEQSFLTMPPEVRNKVYELCFVPSEEFIIVDSLEHNYEPAWNCGYGAMYDSRTEDSCGRWLRGEQFSAYKCDIPTALLRSCRQIYSESASLFYKRNTFVISVSQHRHNPAFRQLRTLTRWIESIGSQRHWLRRVHVDVDAVCSHSCRYRDDRINVVAAVKSLWSRPEVMSCIRFVATGRALGACPRLSTMRHAYQAQDSVQRAKLLLTVFRSLVITDELNVKRYVRPDALLRDILIHDDHLRGTIVFPSTPKSPVPGSISLAMPVP